MYSAPVGLAKQHVANLHFTLWKMYLVTYLASDILLGIGYLFPRIALQYVLESVSVCCVMKAELLKKFILVANGIFSYTLA